MADRFYLKEKYIAARCCDPAPGCDIVGYFSHNDIIKVHRSDCRNLDKSDDQRMVRLQWNEILADAGFTPDERYNELETPDWIILRHHREYGVDYSLKVARMVNMSKQEVFDRHKKLRAAGLIERVKPLIIQYRKGVVDNKWIKHRNHTYYDLTADGKMYLDYYLAHEADQSSLE